MPSPSPLPLVPHPSPPPEGEGARLPLRILWMRDDKAGHLGSARGTLAALAKLADTVVQPWDIRWKSNFVRSVVSRCGRVGLHPSPNLLLKQPPPPGPFDLIVAAGSATLWPCAAMARRLGIPNIFLGSLRAMPLRYFTLAPHIDPPANSAPYLQIDLLPSVITPQFTQAKAAEHLPGFDERVWAVLLGGDGEGYRWQLDDWRLLAEEVAAAAQRASVRLLVATSRRTPPKAEAILRDCWLSKQLVAAADWVHTPENKPRLPVAAMLGAASHVLVTEDSVTMTHEAFASGKSISTLQPASSQGTARLDAITDRIAQSGRLVRRKLGKGATLVDPAPVSLAAGATGASGASGVSGDFDPLARLANQIRERLPMLFPVRAAA